jgi:Na+/phosphate symporter
LAPTSDRAAGDAQQQRANAAARRVALGSLLFKLVGSLIILPFVHPLANVMDELPLRNPSWLSTSTSSTT